MKVIDPGHMYDLDCFDGGDPISLQFMKRQGPNYPGNYSSYPGTNMQEVLRALIDRIKYVDKQIPDHRNDTVLCCFRESLDLLEERAASRHGLTYNPPRGKIENVPTCRTCGHIICSH